MKEQPIRDFSRHTIYGPPDVLPEWMKRYRAMSAEEYKQYSNKVHETGGFDVDGCHGSLAGRIVQIWPTSIDWEPAECTARFAALSKDEGESVEYKQLVKVNMQPVSGTLYYLTFTGIDLKDHAEKLYRAKVRAKPMGGLELLFFEEVADSHTEAKKMCEEITAVLAKIAKKRPRTAPEPGSRRSDAQTEVKKEGRIKHFKIERKELHFNGFCCLLKEIRRQNSSWKYGRVRKAASKKWRPSKLCEKLPYLLQAREEFNKKVDLLMRV